jgi:ABC-type nitrate/sulfonate/bicarbonate transport system substrate-binding protein
MEGIMRNIMRTIVALLYLASPAAMAADQVRVAVSSTSLFFAAVYVAKQMRYFDEHGLDVSITDVGSGSNVIASVVGGSAEFGGAGIRNIAQGVEKGQALKAFGSSLKGFPNFLVVQKGFLDQAGLKPDSPLAARTASLKAKNIAVNDIGGSAGDFVRELFRRAGLGERDAVLINISSTPGRLAALKAKRIDALVGYAPEPETAMLEGYGEILIDSATDIPEIRTIEYIMWFSRANFIQEKPDLVERLTRALGRATKLMQADSATARDAFFAQMAAKAFGAKTDPKLAELQWNNMRSYFATAMATTDEGMAGARKFFHIPAALTDDMLIDNSFARRVDAAK